MLQPGATLKLADNSGAKSLMILSLPGEWKKKYASVGDEVSAVVLEVTPSSDLDDGAIVRAIIVRTKKEKRRVDGSYIRFDDNAAVVINKQGEPLGTRVLGPIAREVKDSGFKRIASLAKEVW